MNITAMISVNPDLISDERNSVEQKFIALWCFMSLVLGILGNSGLLYTLYHKVIPLDGTSKWIVLNLALADLTHTTLVVLPMTITNIAGNTWVLGQELCVLNSILVAPGIVARIVLVNLFAGLRLARCMFPFWRSGISGNSTRTLITVTAVLISSAFPVWNTLAQVKGFAVAVFWGPGSKCAGWPLRHFTIHRLLTILTFGVPCLPLTISNLTLIGFAIFKSKERRSSPNKKNIFLVLMVTCILLLTLIPLNMINFLNYPVLKAVYFLRFATLFVNVSVFLNPFVFFATYGCVREFLIKKIFGKLHTKMSSRSIALSAITSITSQ